MKKVFTENFQWQLILPWLFLLSEKKTVIKRSVTNCFNHYLVMTIKNKSLFSIILRIQCVVRVFGYIEKHTTIMKTLQRFKKCKSEQIPPQRNKKGH